MGGVWSAMSRQCKFMRMTPEERELQLRSEQFDADIMKERIQLIKERKILLLGDTNSGKTTIFKQMRILFMNGFTEIDYLNYRFLVYQNVTEALEELIWAADRMGIELHPSLEPDQQSFKLFCRDLREGYSELNLPIAASMLRIWRSPAIKSCFERRFEFDLFDSAKYFLENLSRISQPSYIPSPQDILCCRQPTATISEINFLYQDLPLRMVDVGGQRAERRKWIHLFDCVDCLLFVSSLGEFDRSSDLCGVQTNRLHQSLHLFKSCLHGSSFRRAHIILFLNKKDIFEEKLKKISFSARFPAYQGRNVLPDAGYYVKDLFAAEMPKNKVLYCHFTNATDTRNINFVFDVCMDIIMRENAKGSGLT